MKKFRIDYDFSENGRVYTASIDATTVPITNRGLGQMLRVRGLTPVAVIDYQVFIEIRPGEFESIYEPRFFPLGPTSISRPASGAEIERQNAHKGWIVGDAQIWGLVRLGIRDAAKGAFDRAHNRRMK